MRYLSADRLRKTLQNCLLALINFTLGFSQLPLCAACAISYENYRTQFWRLFLAFVSFELCSAFSVHLAGTHTYFVLLNNFQAPSFWQNSILLFNIVSIEADLLFIATFQTFFLRFVTRSIILSKRNFFLLQMERDLLDFNQVSITFAECF